MGRWIHPDLFPLGIGIISTGFGTLSLAIADEPRRTRLRDATTPSRVKPACRGPVAMLRLYHCHPYGGLRSAVFALASHPRIHTAHLRCDGGHTTPAM